MKQNLKNAFIFLVGGATGATSTYFITKKIMKNKFDEEIKSVRDEYNKKAEELTKNLKNLEDKVKNVLEEGEEALKEESSKEAVKEEPIKEKSSKEKKELKDIYNKKIKEYKYPEKESKDYKSYASNSSEPYLITEENFEDNEDYNVYEYSFYDDNVVLDYTGVQVNPEEVRELFGSCLDTLDDKNTEFIIVRNDVRMSDYKVVKTHKDFFTY